MAKTKKKQKKIWCYCIPFILLAIIIACYLGGIIIFSERLPFHTFAEGIDYSLQPVEAVCNELSRINTDDVLLTFTYKENGTEKVLYDLTYKDINATVEASIQYPYAEAEWIASIFSHSEATVTRTLSFDQTLLTNLIEEKNSLQRQKDYIKFDEDKYIITNPDVNYQIDAQKVIEQLQSVTYTGPITIDLTDMEVLKSEDSYEFAKTLTEQMDYANSIIGTPMQLNLVGDTMLPIPAKNIKDFIDMDMEKKTYTINEEAVRSYITQLSETYDTLGEELDFTDSKGVRHSILSKTYGWQLNQEQTYANFKEHLETLGTVDNIVIKAAWNYRGYLKDNMPSYGYNTNRYVVVDINAQHVWIFENGEVIGESDCVTGTLKKHGTPTGAFGVLEKKNGKYLTGEDYKTWVNKWMRLTWSGIGLHDAKWRRKFGGDIYKKKGSHGCINLPPAFASKIFDWLEKGDIVFVI